MLATGVGMDADNERQLGGSQKSPWYRYRRGGSIPSGEWPDEAQSAAWARLFDRASVLIWIVLTWAAFAFGMYTLVVEAKTRLAALFIVQVK